MANRNNSIRVGNIGNIGNGSALAIGQNAQAQGEAGGASQTADEIAKLLDQLRTEILDAPLTDVTKQAMLTGAVADMEQAVHEGDPKPAIEDGLKRINANLEGVGAAADNVSGIAQSLMKIARAVGIAVKTVAPFMAAAV